MKSKNLPFFFNHDKNEQISGEIVLSDLIFPPNDLQRNRCYRAGRLVVAKNRKIEILLGHSPASTALIYLTKLRISSQFAKLVGLKRQYKKEITIPGQLILGPLRTQIMGCGVRDLLNSSYVKKILFDYEPSQIAIFPVLREGIKYQIPDALFNNYGCYLDEIVVGANHVVDESVAIYKRRLKISQFKDGDLTIQQRERIEVAFIGDSFASGIALIEIINRIQERFQNIKQIEIVAPLATLLGLARLAAYTNPRINIRVHIFETILNALAPDYYFSAHFTTPELHVCPHLEEEYRHWWGLNKEGVSLADTVCAGFGWSEAFFNPRKQIEMINQELLTRHKLKLRDVFERHIIKN